MIKKCNSDSPYVLRMKAMSTVTRNNIANMIHSKVLTECLFDFCNYLVNVKVVHDDGHELNSVGETLGSMFRETEAYVRTVEAEIVQQIIGTAMKCESGKATVVTMLRSLHSIPEYANPFMRISVESIRKMMQMQFGTIFGISEDAKGVEAKLVEAVLKKTQLSDKGLSDEGRASCGKLLMSVIEWAMCRTAYCTLPMMVNWDLVTGDEVLFDPDKYEYMVGDQTNDKCFVLFPPVYTQETIVVKGWVMQVSNNTVKYTEANKTEQFLDRIRNAKEAKRDSNQLIRYKDTHRNMTLYTAEIEEIVGNIKSTLVYNLTDFVFDDEIVWDDTVSPVQEVDKVKSIGKRLGIMFRIVEAYVRNIEDEIVQQIIGTAMKYSQYATDKVKNMLRPHHDQQSVEPTVQEIKTAVASIRVMMRLRFCKIFGISEDANVVKTMLVKVKAAAALKDFSFKTPITEEKRASWGEFLTSVLVWAICHTAYYPVPMFADWRLVTGDYVKFNPEKYECMDIDSSDISYPRKESQCVVLFPPIYNGEVVIKGQVMKKGQLNLKEIY